MVKEAHYRFEMKVISRGKQARSVVAKAAYRSGSRLKDLQTGRVFDYKSRSQEVVSSTILAPEGAPAWMRQEEPLWNAVEAVSTRSNARMAREVMPSLPVQLSEEEQREMLHGWAQKELVARGMVAQVSIHRSKDGHNPHAHILCTTRAIEGEQFGKVVREWNDVALLKGLRESFAGAVNAALEKAGRDERADHRSLADRGIDRDPAPKMGVAAKAMERKGIETERGKQAIWVKMDNLVRLAARAIERGGEVPQMGTGRWWWQRAQVAAEWTLDRAGDFLRDTSSGGRAPEDASWQSRIRTESDAPAKRSRERDEDLELG